VDNFAGQKGFWWIDSQTTQRGIYASMNSRLPPEMNLDYVANMAKDHGNLGTFFWENSQDLRGTGDTYSGLKMSDSNGILYLIDNANNDNPTAESWGGEYQQVKTGYWKDRTDTDSDLNWSGSNGAMTTYEDRAAWTSSFHERFDWLKGSTTNPPPTTPAPPIALTPAIEPTPTAPPTGTNLLKNGSFEEAPSTPGQHTAMKSMPGWTAISGGTIEVWNAHNGVKATHGTDFVELDYRRDRGVDGIAQGVQTQAGQEYTFTLDARTRPGHTAATNQIEVVWNGKVQTITPTGSWDDHSVKVVGTGGVDNLIVREVASQSKDGYGALIDNLRLVETGTTTLSLTAPTPTPTSGTGDDTITVRVSGDFYLTDPNFKLVLDGKVIDATNAVTADKALNQWQTFTFTGDFDAAGTQTHRLSIEFDNNLYAGAGKDRNLYIDHVTFNGKSNGTDVTMSTNMTKYYDFIL
jgi:hypothetical protein